MYNFAHEIDCPNNKGMANFLWFDYFHDSTVLSIHFDKKKSCVTLEINCIRDIDEKWKELKYNSEALHEYIEKYGDNFIYLLTFKYTEYFLLERTMGWDDYINGRFKVSALLKGMQGKAKKQLYHFEYSLQTDMRILFFPTLL